MYHIKDDKRVRTSAKLIGESLITLLQEKEFNKITITDIQRTSTVGRATFYRLFDSSVDVLEYLTDQTMDRILEHQRKVQMKSSKETIRFYIQEWMDNEVILQAIFDSGHVDVMYRSMQKLTENGGKYFFPGTHLPEKQLDYIVQLASTAMVGGLNAWIRHGKTETADEVYAYLERSVDVFYQVIHIAKLDKGNSANH